MTTDGGGVVGENNGDLALFGSLNEAIGNAAGKGVQVNQVGLFFVKDLTEMVRCLGVAPAIQFWKREGRRYGKAFDRECLVLIVLIGYGGSGDYNFYTLLLQVGGEGFYLDLGTTN